MFLVLILAILIILLDFFVLNKFRKKIVDAKFKDKVINKWGRKSEYYKKVDLDIIKKYFNSIKDINVNKNFIDDNTWLDLDMDEVFLVINQKVISSIGEGYLYKLLREVKYNKEILEERNRIIEYLKKNVSIAQCMQQYLCYIKDNSIELNNYLHRLKNLPLASTKRHIFLATMPIVNIFIFTFNNQWELS